MRGADADLVLFQEFAKVALDHTPKSPRARKLQGIENIMVLQGCRAVANVKPPKGPIGMKQEVAETQALNILAWLAGQDELFGQFLGASGAAAEDVARQARDPAFLGATLDFILMDDQFVLDCARDLGIDPHSISTIRQALPGGQQIHWT